MIVRTEPSPVPAPLPADAISTGEAIAVLADRTLKPPSRAHPAATAYVRHQQRLVRGAEQGSLTEYKLGPRRPRYWSRAEVLALRDRLAAEGFTDKPPVNYHRRTVEAIVKRAERDGLVSVEASAKLAGVTIGAVRKWIQRGRFGARKIGGLWFFDKAQVTAHKRPTPRQPPETVRCSLCGQPFTMQASKAQRAREVAAAAESDELLVFCSDCWAKPEARSLAHSRQKWPSRYNAPERSRAITAQWAEGKRDKEELGESTR